MTQEIKIFEGEHQLNSLNNKLQKLNTKALEVLENALLSPDEKISIDAAKTLIKLNVDISKIINEDAVNRILLQLKTNGLQAPKDTTPLVDFSNIQEV